MQDNCLMNWTILYVDIVEMRIKQMRGEEEQGKEGEKKEKYLGKS